MTEAPIARPKNAYDLLDAVKVVIREEPLRLNMDFVLRVGDDIQGQRPRCGTVACVAGWAWVLTRRKDTAPSRSKKEGGMLERVAKLLFHADEACQVRSAFSTASSPFDKALSHLFFTFPQLEEGTPEYAEAVVTAIEQFQAAHADRLRATKVRVHA